MVSYIQLAPLTYINLVPLPLTVLHLLQILYRAALGTLPMRTMQHKAKQAWVCNAVFILKQMLWTSLYLLSITLTDLAKSTVDMLQNDLLHSKYLSINEYPSCHSAYTNVYTYIRLEILNRKVPILIWRVNCLPTHCTPTAHTMFHGHLQCRIY